MKHVLLATAALAFLCGQAVATEVTPPPHKTTHNPGLDSGKRVGTPASPLVARSASRSSLTSDITVNQSGGSGPGGSGNRSGGRTPDLYAPSINGGNNCSVGISLGGVGQNAGGTLGYSWESEQCSLRQAAALMDQMGDKKAARETLCHVDKFRRAYYSGGTPCAKDANGWNDR